MTVRDLIRDLGFSTMVDDCDDEEVAHVLDLEVQVSEPPFTLQHGSNADCPSVVMGAWGFCQGHTIRGAARPIKHTVKGNVFTIVLENVIR
jgi:hypothetical protein